MRAGALVLVLLSPLFGGWVATGDGDGRWSAGEGKRVVSAPQSVSFDAVARVAQGRPTHAVLTIRLPDADAVLTLVVDGRGRFQADDHRVKVQYDEYGPGGERVFRAGRVEGRVWIDLDSGLRGALSVRLYDRTNPARWRVLDQLDFDLEAAEPEADEPSHGGAVEVHFHDDHHHDTGCDSGWDDDYDDYEADDGYGGGSGGGCEGDDYDSGDSGGGCEGDDLDSGDSGGGCEGDTGGGGGCEGDAIAATAGGCRTRRSPWILRALNWMPYFAFAGVIGVMRRRWL